MRIHYVQHVPFEGLGCIAPWAAQRGHSLSVTRLYAGEVLPACDAFDWLVVLGGPMGIYDEAQYPWLAGEKTFIRGAVAAQKTILGICLGAQLVADVLGGPVTRNPQREIGWFPLSLTAPAASSPLFGGLPDPLWAFHWHGDTFALPPQSTLMASSEGCVHQAFVYGSRIVGLQFHCEVQPENVRALIAHCGDELGDGPFMQTPAQILADDRLFTRANASMTGLLDRLAAQA